MTHGEEKLTFSKIPKATKVPAEEAPRRSTRENVAKNTAQSYSLAEARALAQKQKAEATATKPKARRSILSKKQPLKELATALTEIERTELNASAEESFYQTASEEINPQFTVTKTYKMKDLPTTKERSAPKFNESEPTELLRYLEEVEELFKKYDVTEEKDKKKTACKYAPAATEAEWKAFSSYDKGTWIEFKRDLIASYPEVVLLHRGSIATLDKLCKTYKGNNQLESNESTRLAAFVRPFRAEAVKLLKDPALVSNRDLVTRFMGCLSDEFARRVSIKLDSDSDTKNAIRKLTAAAPAGDGIPLIEESAFIRWEDRHSLPDVIAAATNIAEMGAWSRTGETRVVPNEQRTYGADQLASTNRSETTVKLEETIAQLADTVLNSEKQRAAEYRQLQDAQMRQYQEFQSFMSSFRQNTNMNSSAPVGNNYGAPRVRTNQNNGCYYCKEETHHIYECPYIKKHLELKWIIKNHDNHIRLPGGSQIHTDGVKSRKDIVEQQNYKTPGVIPAAKISQMYNHQERDSPMDEAHYRLHRQYELSKSLRSLTENFGEDALEAVLEERRRYAVNEEEEPALANFP
ncbi:hypothetical protein JR316_0001572 [Psilocybe cubensis]|uniref:Uncharacterized protein n=1 Tax=Psilocybe cubensis TaxID=181762 RepID=A0ACB8H9R9_PSICU|nr:hypothetical protein JR316_0001572 [Psilocybe cubensis]KAH9484673.1 hypothetical protein JR316_0001572 [Psilocybe cubensis]